MEKEELKEEIQEANNILMTDNNVSLQVEDNTNIEEEKEGIQLNDIKFPSFDDVLVDDHVKYEFKLENILMDLENSYAQLEQYGIHFENIITKNKHEILKHFDFYKLNYLVFRANSLILKHEIHLMSYMLQIIFEQKEEKRNKLLSEMEKDYNENTLEELIMKEQLIKERCVSEENKRDILDTIKKGQEWEKIIKNSKKRPSISHLSILVKYLSSVLEALIFNVKTFEGDFLENNTLDFFQIVRIVILFF
jgi:hypothetical protein